MERWMDDRKTRKNKPLSVPERIQKILPLCCEQSPGSKIGRQAFNPSSDRLCGCEGKNTSHTQFIPCPASLKVYQLLNAYKTICPTSLTRL